MTRVAAILVVVLILVSVAPIAIGANGIGITVSAPKVYEERALRAMLEQAEAQLSALRPISGTALDTALGTLQGGRQTSSSFTLTAQGPSAPSVTTTNTQERIDGELVPTGTTATTTSSSVVPVPPAAPTAAALSGAGFGLSARDLLAEQMALTYQIASLRLALERATSDRVNSINGVVLPRYPVVLGFTIGIDRPRLRQVAEVELTLQLEAKDSFAKPDASVPPPPGISLVSVLPTKDAYNVATITDNSVNIGAGQVVSAFQLGAGFFRNRKTHYVVRDVDTLSIPHSPDARHPNEIRVSWQFRPVLGRKIVEPGPRQVFVVLTLDDERFTDEGFELMAKATTRWVRIRKNGVLKAAAEEEHPIPLGSLGYWQIFSDQMLAPFTRNLQLTPLSEEKGLVSVRGTFLSTDSRILVGDKTIDRGNGLAFRDDTGLSFIVPLSDLARADDVYLMNRYQQPVPLRRRPMDTKHSMTALRCSATRMTGTDHYQVEAILEATPPVEVAHLLTVVGETVVAGTAPTEDLRLPVLHSLLRTFESTPCTDTECREGAVKVRFELPADSVRQNPWATIRETFGGPDRAVRCELPVLPAVQRIAVVGKNKVETRLALQGQRLTRLQHALLDGRAITFSEKTDTIAVLDVPSSALAGTEFLLVRVQPEALGEDGEILVLPVKQKVEVKKPMFPSVPTVVQHFSGPLVVAGDNLESVKAVTFEGLELGSSVAGGNLTIHLVSKVTEHSAPRSLTLKLADGAEVNLPLVVRPTS